MLALARAGARWSVLAVLAIAAVTFAACGDDDGSGGGGEQPAALTGTQWLLDTGALGVAGGGDVVSWIRFENGTATGTDGCNQFHGPYKTDGAALQLGPLAGTQMACVGPADAVSRRVQRALGDVARHAIEGETLRLQDASGRTLLTYVASTPSVEGFWRATSVLYDDAIRGVLEGTDLTATFSADGRVTGEAGCNTFGGRSAVTGDTIRIGPLAATEKACTTPEGIAAQEAGYLAALESARRFEQVGEKLTLLDAKGRMAVILVRAP